MGKFRVLHISNNLDEYPQCVKDSDEFPNVVDWVNDDYEMFILNESDGTIYPASEFFHMVEHVKTFSTETQRLEDELRIATEYIKSIKEQCFAAATAKEEHLVCWAVVTHSPIICDNRIELTDKDKTYLAMKRTKS